MITIEDIELTEIEDGFEETEEIPHPIWDTVEEWIDANFATDQRTDAWDAVAVQWMEILAEYLEGDFSLYSAGDVYFLSCLPPGISEDLSSYADQLFDDVAQVLGELGQTRILGPKIVIAIHDLDCYGRYLSHFEGSENFDGGLAHFLDDGYPHLALFDEHPKRMKQALMHEVPLLMIGHLDPPKWVKEGYLSDVILQLPREKDDDEDATEKKDDETVDNEIFQWWREHQDRVDDFWNGTGFTIDDDGVWFFALAGSLFKRLWPTDERKGRRAFIEAASADDSGFAAAQDILNIDLPDFLATLLAQ